MSIEQHNLFPDEEVQKAELDLEYRAGVPEAREEMQQKLKQLSSDPDDQPQETNQAAGPDFPPVMKLPQSDLDLDQIDEIS